MSDFIVDGPLTLSGCFNCGSALHFDGSLPFLCKNQGLNHSHPNFTAMPPFTTVHFILYYQAASIMAPESNMGDTATRQH